MQKGRKVEPNQTSLLRLVNGKRRHQALVCEASAKNMHADILHVPGKLIGFNFH
jgi:hypothetical protein